MDNVPLADWDFLRGSAAAACGKRLARHAGEAFREGFGFTKRSTFAKASADRSAKARSATADETVSSSHVKQRAKARPGLRQAGRRLRKLTAEHPGRGRSLHGRRQEWTEAQIEAMRTSTAAQVRLWPWRVDWERVARDVSASGPARSAQACKNKAARLGP